MASQGKENGKIPARLLFYGAKDFLTPSILHKLSDMSNVSPARLSIADV